MFESRDDRGIQLAFGENKVQAEAREFPPNTFIYPEKSHNGTLQNNVQAVRLLDRAGRAVKIKRSVGWESRSPIVLYFDGNTQTLQAGTYFGAQPSKGKIIK